MTNKRVKELKVRISFEPNRLSDSVLADAYKYLAPSINRTLFDPTETTIEPTVEVIDCKEKEQK